MKDKKVKKKWIFVFCSLLLLILVAIFAVYLPLRNKTKAPVINNAGSDNLTESASTTESNDTPTINDYEKAIEESPTNAENYIKKSEIEYSQGQKEEALKTVEEGLQNSPNDELLKSRKDVLNKEFISGSEQDNPRQ